MQNRVHKHKKNAVNRVWIAVIVAGLGLLSALFTNSQFLQGNWSLDRTQLEITDDIEEYMRQAQEQEALALEAYENTLAESISENKLAYADEANEAAKAADEFADLAEKDFDKMSSEETEISIEIDETNEAISEQESLRIAKEDDIETREGILDFLDSAVATSKTALDEAEDEYIEKTAEELNALNDRDDCDSDPGCPDYVYTDLNNLWVLAVANTDEAERLFNKAEDVYETNVASRDAQAASIETLRDELIDIDLLIADLENDLTSLESDLDKINLYIDDARNYKTEARTASNNAANHAALASTLAGTEMWIRVKTYNNKNEFLGELGVENFEIDGGIHNTVLKVERVGSYTFEEEVFEEMTYNVQILDESFSKLWVGNLHGYVESYINGAEMSVNKIKTKVTPSSITLDYAYKIKVQNERGETVSDASVNVQGIDCDLIPASNNYGCPVPLAADQSDDINYIISKSDYAPANGEYPNNARTEHRDAEQILTVQIFPSTDENNDEDEDGLTDLIEADLGTDPNDADTDDDGLNDGEEVNIYLSSPLETDTDDDDLSDLEEVELGSSPILKDTDEGGVNDGIEVEIDFTDPLNKNDDKYEEDDDDDNDDDDEDEDEDDEDDSLDPREDDGYCNNPFSDVSGWPTNYICRMAEAGVVNGYDYDTFGPWDNLTREQAVKMIVLNAGLEETDDSDIYFRDVPYYRWSNYYLQVAEDHDILQMPGGSDFAPEEAITRETFFLWTIRAAGQSYYGPDLHPFIDVRTNDYVYSIGYETEVETPDEGDKRVIEGYGNIVKPYDKIMRAEAMAILLRAYLAWHTDGYLLSTP